MQKVGNDLSDEFNVIGDHNPTRPHWGVWYWLSCAHDLNHIVESSKIREEISGMEAKPEIEKPQYKPHRNEGFSKKEDKTLIPLGKGPCPIYIKGVGINSLCCTQCKLWRHKICSGITRKLFKTVNIICEGRCTGAVWTLEIEPLDCPDKWLEVVSSVFITEECT